MDSRSRFGNNWRDFSTLSTSSRNSRQFHSKSTAQNYYDNSYQRRRWPPCPFVEDEKDAIRNEFNPTVCEEEIPCRGTVDQEEIIEEIANNVDHHARFVWENINSHSTQSSKSSNYSNHATDRKSSPYGLARSESGFLRSIPDIVEPQNRDPAPYGLARSDTGTLRETDQHSENFSHIPERKPTPYGLARSETGNLRDLSSIQNSIQSNRYERKSTPYGLTRTETGNLRDADYIKDKTPNSFERKPSPYGLARSETGNLRTTDQTPFNLDQSMKREHSPYSLSRSESGHLKKSDKLSLTGDQDLYSRLGDSYSEFRPPSSSSHKTSQTSNEKNTTGFDKYADDPRHANESLDPYIGLNKIKSATVGRLPSRLNIADDHLSTRHGSIPGRSSPTSPGNPYRNSKRVQGDDIQPPQAVRFDDDMHDSSRRGPTSFKNMNRSTETERYPRETTKPARSNLPPTQIPDPSSNSHDQKPESVFNRVNAHNKIPYPDFDSKGGGASLPYPTSNHPIAMPDQTHFISTPTAASFSTSTYRQVEGSFPAETKLDRDNDTDSQRRPRGTAPNYGTSGIRFLSESISNKIAKLSVCPMKNFTDDRHDWYSILGVENFDICTECYRNIIAPSKFYNNFRPGRRSSSTYSIQCDFGNPWVRLAWVKTLDEDKPDLKLLYSIINVLDSTDRNPCPDKSLSIGPWYGFLDQDSKAVSDFFCCRRDKDQIEVLFPALKGHLVQLATLRESSKRLCSLRCSYPEFSAMIDGIENLSQANQKLYDKAPVDTIDDYLYPPKSPKISRPLSSRSTSYGQTSSTAPLNLTSLIQLIENLNLQSLCPQDRPTQDMAWHFLSAAPNVTICGSCFTKVIAPAQYDGSDVALLFSPIARFPSSDLDRYTPGYHNGLSDGRTCALYSDRMRGIWKEAVYIGGRDGLRHWLKYSTKRQEKEVKLNDQKFKLESLLRLILEDERHMQSPSQAIKDEKERCLKGLDRLEDEWAMIK